MKSLKEKLFSFVMLFIMINCAFCRRAPDDGDDTATDPNYDYRSAVHLDSLCKYTSNCQLTDSGKTFNNYLSPIEPKKLVSDENEIKDQSLLNGIQNRLIKKRSIMTIEMILDNLSNKDKYTLRQKMMEYKMNVTKAIQKSRKERSIPSVINYFMSYLAQLLSSEEVTKEKSTSERLTKMLLDDKNVSTEEDKSTVIIPIEDTKLVSDLKKEIQTEDAQGDSVQNDNKIPNGKKELMFIQKLTGTSTSDMVEDFVEQIQERQLEAYNSIEEGREGLLDEEGDEDSETDA